MASVILSQGEERVLHLLKQAWDEYKELETLHPSDFFEFMLAIHQAQNIIMARPATLEQKKKDEPMMKVGG